MAHKSGHVFLIEKIVKLQKCLLQPCFSKNLFEEFPLKKSRLKSQNSYARYMHALLFLQPEPNFFTNWLNQKKCLFGQEKILEFGVRKDSAKCQLMTGLQEEVSRWCYFQNGSSLVLKMQKQAENSKNVAFSREIFFFLTLFLNQLLCSLVKQKMSQLEICQQLLKSKILSTQRTIKSLLVLRF